MMACWTIGKNKYGIVEIPVSMLLMASIQSMVKTIYQLVKDAMALLNGESLKIYYRMEKS